MHWLGTYYNAFKCQVQQGLIRNRNIPLLCRRLLGMGNVYEFVESMLGRDINRAISTSVLGADGRNFFGAPDSRRP